MPRSSTSTIPKHVFHNAIERVQQPPSAQGMFNLLPFKQLCANDFHPDYHTKPVPRAESQTKAVVSVQPPYPPPIMPPSGGNLMLLGGEDWPKRRVAKSCRTKTRARASPVAVKKSTKHNMSTAPSRSTRSKTKHPPKSPQHNDTQAPSPNLLDLPHNCTQRPAAVTHSLLPPCSSIMLGLCGDVPPCGHPSPTIPLEVGSAWNTIQTHKVIDDLTISTAPMPPCTERLPSFKERFGDLGRPHSARYPMPRPTLPPLRCPGPELLDLLRGRERYWREDSSSSSSSDEEALDGSGCGSSSDATSAGGSAYSPNIQEAYTYPYARALGRCGEDVGVSSGDVVQPPRACIMRPVWSWRQTWA
ncbi:hypothetical protein D9611_014346 [Ephemerocybe angulata]|uniref:Uncharacterized protein n=1 Tax=Ephemerocybe angulata TaxID=980116 RepID=A0A8H5B7W9_9AGAR|nr:hypothetical protein D9611_014346 [Tulosesus angulatus]